MRMDGWMDEWMLFTLSADGSIWIEQSFLVVVESWVMNGGIGVEVLLSL